MDLFQLLLQSEIPEVFFFWYFYRILLKNRMDPLKNIILRFLEIFFEYFIKKSYRSSSEIRPWGFHKILQIYFQTFLQEFLQKYYQEYLDRIHFFQNILQGFMWIVSRYFFRNSLSIFYRNFLSRDLFRIASKSAPWIFHQFFQGFFMRFVEKFL